MMEMIKTAIILVSGMGGRLYPLTKVIPKEMLPIMGKPAIQHIVDECLEAKIEKVIICVRCDSDLTKRYFYPNERYDEYVKSLGIEIEQKNYENIVFIKSPKLFKGMGETLSYVLQKEDINDEYFAVLSGDDIIIGENVMCNLIESFKLSKNVTIAYQRTDEKRAEKFGNVMLEKNQVIKINEKSDELMSLNSLITKIIMNHDVTKYILQAEFKLDLAISEYCKKNLVTAVEVKGEWLNIDDFDDYLQANIFLRRL